MNSTSACLGLGLLLLLGSSLASAHSVQQPGLAKRPPWAAPELECSVSVRDGRSGAILAFGEFLDALAAADVVFLGETHTDETTHRVELGVYEGLAERRSGRVVLAMEMFERDVQPSLDDYLAGRSSEQEFLAASRPWANYDTGYRPLVEFARGRGLPVVASNFPSALRLSLARLGNGATLEALGDEARLSSPRRLFANSPAYWRRVDNAVRGHIGMMGANRDDDQRLYSTQSLWDNSMGEACALALEEHPGSSVLHVNGGFHSAYWDGTVRQLRLRKPDAQVLTVAIVPFSAPATARPRGVAPADYLVYAEARATDLNEGTHSVYVQAEIKYRLHLPERAPEGDGFPLLIWFGDDGFDGQDGLALWRERLGEECAIAAVEAPYRETQEDLVEGGRWFWPDSFSSDLGALEVATERIWGYLLRHYPLDPTRVVLGGEGTGATVVSAVSLASDRMDLHAVALSPRHYAKLKDIPLPLPELRGSEGPRAKLLQLLVAPGDEAWWAGELAEYETVGFESSQALQATDPWLVEAEGEAALRGALGLPLAPPAPGAARRHIVARSPRARLWARLLAAREARRDGVLIAVLDEAPNEPGSTAIETEVRPEDFESGERLPRCPGPFGGTTVVVLPESTAAAQLEAWLALEKNDPLERQSRFHHLRIATLTGERNLPLVLAELSRAGRKNVLVVPAAFCEDGETMRALRRSARALEDQMTLRWRPGFGG